MRTLLRNLSIAVLVGAICAISIFYAKKALTADYKLYKAESACVAKLISTGRIHRKDIWTKDGTCGEKE